MVKKRIIPIVLGGGAGTRMWPLSRQAGPKQFVEEGGESSLLERALRRCSGPLFDMRPIIVGAAEHKERIVEIAQGAGCNPEILLEVEQRDSCAAIAAGAARAFARDEHALVLVLAADHHIPDVEAFTRAVSHAQPAAAEGYLVAFGIRPDFPETRYGYIEAGSPTGIGEIRKIAGFVEKPDLTRAKQFVESGFLWNSGNFLFQAKAALREISYYEPAVATAALWSLQRARRSGNVISLDRGHFSTVLPMSFDVAIMEKTKRAAVLPVEYEWRDLGTWDDRANATNSDLTGNAAVGQVVLQNCENTFVHSNQILTTVIDCEDLVIVTTPDAVMVMKRGSSEKVKGLVEQLRQQGRAEV